MNGKKIVGNGSKATLPGGQKLSDKIQENKTKQGLNNNPNKKNNNNLNGNDNLNSNSKSSTKNQKGEEKPKGKLDNAAQGLGSEALKKSLKAAFPYIPQFIINKLVDSKMGQALIEKTLNKTKKKIIFGIVAGVATVLMGLFFMVMVLTLILAPVALVSDFVKGIVGWFKSFGNWFIGKGWCATTEECQQLNEGKYYEKLNDAVAKYSGSCSINPDLITATIFYGQMVSEEGIESSEKEDEKGNAAMMYYDFSNVSETSTFYKTADSQVKKLINVYLKGEEAADDDENDEEFEDYDSCSFAADKYKKYLIDNYIDWAYPSVITATRTKEVIAEEIMRMGNVALIKRAFASSVYCSSIAVEQSDGNIESMDLEDYVARVVTKENGWYEGDNIENMKAQAIASRTYALNATNNCSTSIKNSATQQTLADQASDMALKATEETKGLVLLEDGKVFSSEYDALAIASSDDTNYYLKQSNLAIPKTWLDSKLKKTDYEWYAKHNHGRGMSQWGSRYLQTIGKNYEDILGTFYTMAEISKMGGLITGGNYSSNITPVVDVTELAERRDYYKSIGIDYIYSESASNVSQCPWYAKSRAIEIIYYSNMDESLKNTVIESLKNTSGHGRDWYNTPDATIFTKTTDYTKPMPGSIVSWSSSGKQNDGTSCHTYGHVAIVEQVLEDGKVLVSEGWNNGGADSGNNWSKVAYQVKERNLDYIKSHTNQNGCTYTFNGYVYLLG